MASLLPLLQDLLPMIMPSEVRVARNHELVPIAERAERPPWYQSQQRVRKNSRQRPVAQGQPQSSVPAVDVDVTEEEEQRSVASEESDPGNAEPIQLFDHEGERMTTATGPGLSGHPWREVRNGPPDEIKGAPASAPRPIDGPAVFRKDAMVGVSDMSATVLTVKPRSASAIHHHGEQDAMIYAAAGQGVLLISPSVDPVKAIRADIKGEAPTREEEQPRRIELSPGDFAFVPAWTEHQAVNESNDVDVVWVVTRNGGEPLQVDLEGWGGDAIER